MKTLTRSLTLLAILTFASSASAQTLLNNFTLGAAMAIGDRVATVSSISTMAQGDVFYCDQEAMTITQTPTAGTLLVNLQRGTGTGQGGIVVGHANGVTCFSGASGLRWHTTDPNWGAACIRGQQLYLPWINVFTGVNWTCGYKGNSATASLVWRATSPVIMTYNSIQIGRYEPTSPHEQTAMNDSPYWRDVLRSFGVHRHGWSYREFSRRLGF